jgi:hypothetical protein
MGCGEHSSIHLALVVHHADRLVEVEAGATAMDALPRRNVPTQAQGGRHCMGTGTRTREGTETLSTNSNKGGPPLREDVDLHAYSPLELLAQVVHDDGAAFSLIARKRLQLVGEWSPGWSLWN